MKQKIIIILSVLLLLMLVGFMIMDFFFNKPTEKNPYEFEINKLRTGDTTQARYTETAQIKPSMEEIHGIATDTSGRIFVSGRGSVEIFNSSGKPESVFSIAGVAGSLAIGKNEKVFLGIDDHVEVWTIAGKKLAHWQSCGQEAVITSIAASDSFVFVADAGQKVVCKFDLKGNMISKIGLKDPATGVPGFVIPSPYFDLGISSDGYLWVVNPGRHSFEKYDFEGKLLDSWGKGSMAMQGFCGCCNPSNFAFLNDDFVTSEKAIERVKVYNPDGSFQCVVAMPEQFEEGTKGLDLATDRRNRILVLDPVRRLVRIFEVRKTL